MAVLCGFLLTSLLPALCSLPANAQSWTVTTTGTNPDGSPTSFNLPGPTFNGCSLGPYSVSTTISTSPNQSPSGSAQFTVKFGFLLVYTPSAAGEPPPAVIRFTESSSTSWSNSTFFQNIGSLNTAGSFANDGLGDTEVHQTSAGTHTVQINVPTANNTIFYRTLSANSSGALVGTLGGASASLQAKLNSYKFTGMWTPGAVKVDQDQQVFAPAPTTRFSATVSNAAGFAIDWIKISVDGGTPQLATIYSNNPNQGYIDWDSSGAANPSEHTITATAQIHDSIGIVPLDSARPEGNGRPADDIIADVRLKSLDFINAYTLRNQASVSSTPSPDPAIVADPQFVWNQNGIPGPLWNQSSNPGGTFAAPTGDVQGTSPLLYVTPYPFTGPATVGFTLKVQAAPNTVNATTGQPDPTLTLYDNTSAAPVSLSSSGSGTSAQVMLYPKVAKYGLTTSALSLWVKFTGVTPNVWKQVGASYASTSQPLTNTLYAVLATPKVPMNQPWVGVLDKVCTWAKGTANATGATNALVKGLYDNGDYQPGYTGYTKIDFISTNPPIYVRDFQINRFLNSGMSAPCWDFAAAMVCFSNALGAVLLQMQTQQNTFTTNKFTRANLTGSGSNLVFLSHAWSNAGGQIYDGAIKFGGTTYVTGLSGPLEASDYFNGLVSQPPSQGWSNGVTGLNDVNPTN